MRPVLSIFMLAALVACQRTPEPAAAPDPVSTGAAPIVAGPLDPITYYCLDGRKVVARYTPPAGADLDVAGRAYSLTIATSASGSRYVGDGVQWWTKGSDHGRLSPLKPGEAVASASGVSCSTPDAPVEPPDPGEPGGLPADRKPISEPLYSSDSALGAANLVQAYYSLVGGGKYAQAWKIWSDGGRASGMTEAEFTASFDKYMSYRAQVGSPGPMEGAAGSLYVEVPVVIYGRYKAGPELHQNGKVVLRRVNDVPGSTLEQRRWHIARIELKATDHFPKEYGANDGT